MQVAREFDRALLHRVHPTKPSGLPAFQFLQRHYAASPRPAFLRDLLQHVSGYNFIVDTAKVLEREGYSAKARWMLDIGRAEMPDRFMMRAYSDHATAAPIFGYDARFAGNRELYTEREKKRRLSTGQSWR